MGAGSDSIDRTPGQLTHPSVCKRTNIRQYARVRPIDDMDWAFVRDNSKGAQWMVIFSLVFGVITVASEDLWLRVMFAVGTVFGIGSAWNYRYVRMKAGPSGVLIRNPVRIREFGWDDISHFEVGSSLNGAANGSAIRVILRDGTGMTAMAGSALRRAEVADDVNWLNDYSHARSAEPHEGE
jgi:hypothetical protein